MPGVLLGRSVIRAPPPLRGTRDFRRSVERVAVEVGRGPENLGAVVPATAPEDLLGAVGTGALEDGETVALIAVQ